MARKYTHVKHLEPIVFKMKKEGISNAEVAETLGLSKSQVKDLVKRHNRRARSVDKIPAKAKGRPRKQPIKSWKALEAENERLKMENELLRDFLSATERK